MNASDSNRDHRDLEARREGRTKGNTHCDGTRAEQAMNEKRPHEVLSVTVQKIFVNVIETPNRD